MQIHLHLLAGESKPSPAGEGTPSPAPAPSPRRCLYAGEGAPKASPAGEGTPAPAPSQGAYMQVKVNQNFHLLGKALLWFWSTGACPFCGCVVPHQGDRRPGHDNDGNADDHVTVDGDVQLDVMRCIMVSSLRKDQILKILTQVR